MNISIIKLILTNRGDNVGFNTIDTLTNIVQILSQIRRHCLCLRASLPLFTCGIRIYSHSKF